jgi:hypothetical protein
MLAMLGNTPEAARKQPRYLGPTAVQVANKIYPIPPILESTAIISPLCCVLSAIHVVAIVTRNERKYGGAVSPWALTAVKPTILVS